MERTIFEINRGACHSIHLHQYQFIPIGRNFDGSLEILDLKDMLSPVTLDIWEEDETELALYCESWLMVFLKMYRIQEQLKL